MLLLSFSVPTFFKDLTPWQWVAVVLITCSAVVAFLFWRADTSHKRASRRVTAFRDDIWDNHRHLYKHLPHFDRMVEWTLSGVPLTMERYFTEDDLNGDLVADLIFCHICKSTDIDIKLGDLHCGNCGFRWPAE